MKKIFATIAAVLFVLSFAGAAFAIHAEIPAETQAVVAKGGTQITLGGELRMRGWLLHNREGGSDVSRSVKFYDANNNGTLDSADVIWTDSSTTLYTFRLPSSEVFKWTNTSGTRVNTAGVASAYAGGWSFTKDEKGTTDSYYDYRVRLNLEAKVTPNVIGFVQLETGTGTSDKWFYGEGTMNAKPNNGKGGEMGVLQAWMQYTGTGLFGFNSGLKVGHMPLKLGEGQFFDHTQLGDDAIVFFMDPTKAIHVGLLTIKFDEGTTRLDNTDDTDGYVALMTYKVNDKNTVGVNYVYLNNSDAALKLQNLGFHANGSFGNFGYKGEVDFQFGKQSDMRFRGYGVMLAGNYNVNPVNIRAKFAYGSGDDNSSDSKIKSFQTFNGAIQNHALIYDYLVDSANLATLAGDGYIQPSSNRGTGIANTVLYNIGADFKATKDITLGLDGYIFRAAKNGFGSKNAGWEVDAMLKYAVAKNLTYQIDAGYFHAGKLYEDFQDWWSGSSNAADTDNITVLRHMLTLSF